MCELRDSMSLRRRLGISGCYDWIIIASVILFFLGIIALVFYGRAVAPLKTEYTGTIVDKTLNIQEEQTGSHIELFLRIEGDDGKQFNVTVDQGLYDRAKIGMHIKHGLDGSTLTY